jgi:hypothetical protein
MKLLALTALLLTPVKSFSLFSSLCKHVAPKTVDQKFVQEAEFKHARVAMLATPILFTMAATGVEEPAKWLSQQPMDTQLMFFGSAALLEGTTSLRRLGPNFSLRDDIVPGNFISNKTDVDTDLELATGRIAMLASAGTMLSSLIN